MRASGQTTGGASADAAAPQRDLARLIDGYLTTELLYVAAKLGVADVLANGPRTGAEIADAVGADADALTRVLRGLALEDVVTSSSTSRASRTVRRPSRPRWPIAPGARPPTSWRPTTSPGCATWWTWAGGRASCSRRSCARRRGCAASSSIARRRCSGRVRGWRGPGSTTMANASWAQYGRLLADAGFALQRVLPTRSAAGLSVLEAVVASPGH